MSLLDKSSGILDLLKAESPPASPKAPEAAAAPSAPSAPASSGAPAAGAESRKRGGKYISREWVNGRWEYTYQDEPHESGRHGIENAYGKHGHTLDTVPKTDGTYHQDPEMAYRHAKDKGAHSSPKAGYVGHVVDPATGQNLQLRISGVQKAKGGKFRRMVTMTPVTADGKTRDPNGKKVQLIHAAGEKKREKNTRETTREFGTKEEAAAGANKTWEAVHAFLQGRAAAEADKNIKNPTVTGPDGKVHGAIMQIAQGRDVDREGNVKERGRQNWRIKLTVDSPLNAAYTKGQTVYETPQAADSGSRYLSAVVAKIHEEAANPKPPVAESLAAGKSHTDLLLEGQVPFGVTVRAGGGEKKKHTIRRFENDWGSEQGQLDAMRDLAAKYEDVLMSAKETDPNVDGSEITHLHEMDPSSSVTKTLRYVVANYGIKGKAKGDLGAYITKTLGLYSKFKAQGTTSLEGSDTASSLDDLVQAAEFQLYGDHIPSGIDQTESFGGDKVTRMKDAFIQAQEQQLNELAQEVAHQPQALSLVQQFKEILDNEVRNADLSAHGTNQVSAERALAQPLHELADRVGLPDDLRSRFVASMTKSYSRLEGVVAMIKAVAAMEEEESFEKANFNYSHKEGNSMYPQYMYKDEAGNYSRRTNAPKGHTDYDGSYSEAEEDQLTQEAAPQFYTHDGRKLSRAPYTGVDVKWNSNYHKNDPENLWAARWVNPVTGEHEFAYIDADLIESKQYKIHRENALTDARLPFFRQYVSALFRSVHQKDKTVAVMLALLDQARFRVNHLMSLRVRDALVGREIVIIGGRKIHAGPNVVQHLGTLTAGRHPDEPLFATAPVSLEGEMEYDKMRRLGPHFVVNLLYELGVSAESLQTYHASQSYSMTIQRIFGSHNVSYGAAHHFTMLEVASEMGHDLGKVEDYATALIAIEQSAVDPIVVQAIKRTCESQGIGTGGEPMLSMPVYDSIPHVSILLTGRTPEEEEFSKWLRTVPLHNYPGQEDLDAATATQMPVQ